MVEEENFYQTFFFVANKALDFLQDLSYWTLCGSNAADYKIGYNITDSQSIKSCICQ